MGVQMLQAHVRHLLNLKNPDLAILRSRALVIQHQTHAVQANLHVICQHANMCPPVISSSITFFCCPSFAVSVGVPHPPHPPNVSRHLT